MKKSQLLAAVAGVLFAVTVMPTTAFAAGSGIIGKNYAGGTIGYQTGNSANSVQFQALGNMNVHQQVDVGVFGNYGTGDTNNVDVDNWAIGARATGFMPLDAKTKAFVRGDVFYQSVKTGVTTKKAGANIGGGVEYQAFDKGFVSAEGLLNIWNGDTAFILAGNVGYWMSPTVALIGGLDYNFDSKQVGFKGGALFAFK